MLSTGAVDSALNKPVDQVAKAALQLAFTRSAADFANADVERHAMFLSTAAQAFA
jgi:hypothetical protein